MAKMQSFKNITQVFEDNIHALRVFSQQIGRSADEHDLTAIGQFVAAISNVIGVNSPETKGKDPQETMVGRPNLGHSDLIQGARNGEIEEENDPGEGAEEIPLNEQVQRLKERLLQLVNKRVHPHPSEERIQLTRENILQLDEASKSFREAAPVQGSLLRQSSLIILPGILETLVSDLIQAFYLRNPRALPADDKMLSLADLRDIGSVEEAEKYLVAKEVDGVLRDSLENQLDYFTKKLKLKLNYLDTLKPHLIEVAQRRNLFVHNRGVVNRAYLSRVAKEYIENSEISEGGTLAVSDDYLSHAIDNIYLCGFILLQQAWRKWEKDGIKKADDAVMDASFQSLCEERYNVTRAIADFVSTLETTSDHCSRIVAINHAIALRDTGKLSEIEGVLSAHDWSACSLRFLLALCVLREKEDELFLVFPRAIAAGEIQKESLLEWPLFKPLWGNPRFIEVIHSAFSQEQSRKPSPSN